MIVDMTRQRELASSALNVLSYVEEKMKVWVRGWLGFVVSKKSRNGISVDMTAQDGEGT
jgi:hypothetical protein